LPPLVDYLQNYRATAGAAIPSVRSRRRMARQGGASANASIAEANAGEQVARPRRAQREFSGKYQRTERRIRRARALALFAAGKSSRICQSRARRRVNALPGFGSLCYEGPELRRIVIGLASEEARVERT